jgi:hypothetical protein
MPAPHAQQLQPFYYLDNFQLVLDWVGERYRDLLDDEELAFIARFRQLPQASRALLTRMVMRKGELFRASKLRYEEIGAPQPACAALQALGWVEHDAPLAMPALFSLFTKAELSPRFPALARGQNKAGLLAQLLAAPADTLSSAASPAAPRPLRDWLPACDDTVYRITVLALCERLRLMFFGNCHQSWTDFILSDLGIYRYEQVAFCRASRSFQSRQEVDDYLFLEQCRAGAEAGEALDTVLQALPATPFANPWLESRRQALLFQIAQQYERGGDLPAALAVLQNCSQRGARARTIRVLELLHAPQQALALAETAAGEPESDAESQQVARMLPRLRRLAGAPKAAAVAGTGAGTARIDLRLPPGAGPGVEDSPEYGVEEAARRALASAKAPVFYVENGLINSLFGLLCWDAIFTPLPGAFFHPFHAAPADLHRPDFHARRQAQFARCLGMLDDGSYRQTIQANFAAKAGLLSPFVYWDLLDARLLELALDCIAPAHLKQWCMRILADIKSNRSGLPDLIQFWPGERRYRMIEVKGPGDRLQDNQLRWLSFCAAHAMPTAVCHVEWMAP